VRHIHAQGMVHGDLHEHNVMIVGCEAKVHRSASSILARAIEFGSAGRSHNPRASQRQDSSAATAWSFGSEPATGICFHRGNTG
jgi:hypothetical protein